ncbi:hypothetical protein CBR_g41699 [Chara braunii]|uniref:HAT C-terminal dimerisation domain-containing protein n=1 Tax=Chara braunii TaxID=69332 RepID=A0A388LWF7_CHABU|nr:hypothetical protein CBR_g41699 [Chara braunii]|eukprot:GBG86636.1 hypothetical protein CBR_g41699 [Chara braunii]
MTCSRDHVVWTWVTPREMLPDNARGSRRLRYKLCNKEYSGNRKRAWEHFILVRASARCPHSNLSIWRRLHGIGVQLPPDMHERVQRVLEMKKSDEGDTPVLGGGEGGEGGIAEDPGEAPGGDTMEVDIGEDEGTRGVVTGGLATAGRASSSQAVVQGARTRGPTRQTSIRRFAKNPRQEDMDDSCCEFFVENAIPFNAARSKSFKKFMLTCIGPQPVGSHPLVPTGYNPLRCCLLDRLNKRLVDEEQAIRDDWQRLEVCERAIVRIVTGHGWETMLWRGDIRAKAYFVEKTVLDKAFWADVKKLTAVMKGPYNVLREVDKDVHCLSRIYDMACRLPGFVCSAPLSADQRDDLLKDVGNKTDMLLSPIHAVARLLDPMLRDITVFSNVDLMAQFESVVERLIEKSGSSRFDDCMDQLYEFQFGRGVFGTPQAKKRAEKDNAVLWWEAHGAGHPKIRELALKDGATVAGGWLGLTADWEDEDLEGDMANVTEAVDDIEAAGEGTASAVGSTNIRPDPTAPSTSRSTQRLVQVEEEDEDETDEDDDDDVPDEEWVDERSDSDRSWTRREGMFPYVEGTRSGLRSQTRARPEAQQGEQQQQEQQQQEQVEQQQERVEQQQQQQQEQQQEQEQEKQRGQGDEEQHQQRGDEEQQQHETDEEQPQQREKEQQQQRVDLAVQQETAVQSSRDVHEEGEAEGEQSRREVRGFYGSSQRSPLVGRHGAHPGRVWDPLAYCAPQ